MDKSNAYTWEDMKAAEAAGMQKGEFQGTVMQALQDIRGDVTKLDDKIKGMQTDSRIKNYINMAIAGISGIVAGIIGGRIRIGN